MPEINLSALFNVPAAPGAKTTYMRDASNDRIIRALTPTLDGGTLVTTIHPTLDEQSAGAFASHISADGRSVKFLGNCKMDRTDAATAYQMLRALGANLPARVHKF